jgi:hypothetical protein
MFEILNIVISIGVIFLILSMIQKYVMSMIKRMFGIKAKVITSELGNILDGYLIKYFNTFLMKADTALVGNKPVSSKKSKAGVRVFEKDQLKEIIDQFTNFIESKSVKQVAEVLHIEDIGDKAEKEIENIKEKLQAIKESGSLFYDDTMAKISKVYEDKMRKYTIISAAIFALCINADFFQIYHSLFKQPLISESIAVNAAQLENQITALVNDPARQGEITDIKAEISNVTRTTAEIKSLVNSTGLEFGWTQEEVDRILCKGGQASSASPKEYRSGVSIALNIFSKLAGIFTAALLISFGAPFWHDWLSSFTSMRKGLSAIRTARAKEADGSIAGQAGVVKTNQTGNSSKTETNTG